MKLRQGAAEGIGAASEWALTHVLHRPGANFPGKVGLYVDPQLIADLRSRLREGAVVVVGTNGKTTVTNMLADAFEAAGKTVACNRTGANLDSGVASALLHAREADWGVLECDELWLAKVLPQLQPRSVVLLNLFRDQLDRMGEIDHIQDSIAGALAASPATVLIYNCDDPLCQAIADRVENEKVPFGIGEDLGLAQNTVADASICQRCDSPLEYQWRQYGQLGTYRCPHCGFARTAPAYAAREVELTGDGTSLVVRREGGAVSGLGSNASCDEDAGSGAVQDAGTADGVFQMRVSSPFAGAYMAYNLLAVCTAAVCCNVPSEAATDAVRAFAPDNGRLQRYEIDGCRILLNLAKNPTGFNQNLRIIEGDTGPKAVAFFINDKEADGHDVSWLWDVDFQELAACGDLLAFAGGIRGHDMQVRLKYAGIDARLVDGAEDFVAMALAKRPDAHLYLIANYTALPTVKAELDQMAHLPEPAESEPKVPADKHPGHPAGLENEKLVIAHLYPELLNLYGDGGNVIVLAERARKRGIDVEVVCIGHGDKLDLADADIVFLGGGPDREQRLASQELFAQAGALRAYVEDDGVLLAICGGYQILGREWILGDDTVAGLGIVDVVTKRAEGGSHNRLVGNIMLDSPLAHLPVIGYENHAGRTFIGASCQPFGRITSHHGHGNNDTDKADGVLYRNVIGTYLHGPLLAKNPEVADCLIVCALARRAGKEGRIAPALPPLDDSAERAANAFMANML